MRWLQRSADLGEPTVTPGKDEERNRGRKAKDIERGEGEERRERGEKKGEGEGERKRERGREREKERGRGKERGGEARESLTTRTGGLSLFCQRGPMRAGSLKCIAELPRGQ